MFIFINKLSSKYFPALYFWHVNHFLKLIKKGLSN